LIFLFLFTPLGLLLRRPNTSRLPPPILFSECRSGLAEGAHRFGPCVHDLRIATFAHHGVVAGPLLPPAAPSHLSLWRIAQRLEPRILAFVFLCREPAAE